MRRGAFARDWEVIRLSRTWQPTDVAEAVLAHLLDDPDPGLSDAVREAARAAGRDQGEVFRERAHNHPDPLTVVEAVLLSTGISAEREDGPEGVRLIVDVRPVQILPDTAGGVLLAAAYLEGFISSIIPEASVDAGDEQVVVTIPEGG